MSFRDKIPGAFGIADFKFANHPNDAQRAIELLKVCDQDNVPLSEVLTAV